MSGRENSSDSGRPQVYLVGRTEGLVELRHTLLEHGNVELLGWSEDASKAAATLAAWDVDVVLLGADLPALPTSELAVLREQTRAPVFLLAPARAASLLEETVADAFAGAVILPQPVESIIFTIRKATARQERGATAAGRVVTVFSPKGGTGKTVLATNVAAAYAGHDLRALLVDLDLQFGDGASMLGLEPTQTIHDLVAAPGDLDAEKLAGYTEAHESGLALLAAPERPEEAELVPVGKVSLLLEVAREAYDVVVVDTSPFLQGPVLGALDQTDELLVVSTLEIPTLKDVRRSLETLDLISFPAARVSLVLNRADLAAGIRRDEAESALGIAFRFAVPDEKAVSFAVNRGVPLVLAEPNKRFSRAVRELAAALLSEPVGRRRAASAESVRTP